MFTEPMDDADARAVIILADSYGVDDLDEAALRRNIAVALREQHAAGRRAAYDYAQRHARRPEDDFRRGDMGHPDNDMGM